ncbi:phosphotransferase enzyme family protein [Butyrivibrio proteoclasticus]|uniref:phosphotransferase enzyme family protein n=1 Tax=Butyrivibrio proteoclasticus TaxID=43305 RepID=UPI00047A4346|nr:aminoglycoside phosphotransferase family protein [Butyrivibrio proteoclasticus]
MEIDIRKIVEHFDIDGEMVYEEPFGCGHINDTYAIYCKRELHPPVRYILQRINSEIFDVDKLMHNICLVTDYLKEKIAANGGDPLRSTLTLVRTRDGKSYYRDSSGSCYRIYLFIENTVSYQSAATREVLENAGRAFGNFQKLLFDFDASKLYEVIPNFHNTVKRYEAFERAIAEGIPDRVKAAEKEISFATERKNYCDRIVSKLGSDQIPLRVTHNDTKLNNILMDPDTNESVCIIDLDTIMPGSLLYDFGDSIRFGANTATEDETDLSKVRFDAGMYDAYAKGFLSEMEPYMTRQEIDLLPFSSVLMTYECAIRFLSDFLVGDTYFKVDYPTHNLDRTRNQFKLIEDMESYWGRF